MTSMCDFGSKKWIKYQNNVRNVFRDIKIPLENIMGHWNGIVWSIFEKSPKNMVGATFFLGGGVKKKFPYGVKRLWIFYVFLCLLSPSEKALNFLYFSV